ncbi:JmjC domain-containing protein [Aphelenchoides fujianensis]|nr:JmjC domain-containing protein [Aphelenchoides fujianensis]
MEKRYAQWYRNFKPPPESRIFRPTEAEFADPIAYVESIKAEAEKYGVVKVVPPPSFRPPRASNRCTASMRLCRDRIFFVHELKAFWKNAGRDFKWSYIGNTYIDFVSLRDMVREAGGVEEVSNQRKWADFTAALGFDRSEARKIKEQYTKWIEPFEEHWLNRDKPHVEAPTAPAPTVSNGQKKPASRMMAGVTKRVLPPRSAANKSPIKENACGKCSKIINRDPHVACTECHQEFHKACLSRMLNNRSSRAWKCVRCLASDVQDTDFFFSDKEDACTLREFHQMASNFKAKHFKTDKYTVCASPPSLSFHSFRSGDPRRQSVEREYWKNVGDFDSELKVEYGADLLSSEISSGFPSESRPIAGVSPDVQQRYARHPWNLNNLPVVSRSVLGHVGTEISGMMIPWVYVGMCFSTFCWHVEDHWTYSMNYMHRGETKVWYGFGEEYAEQFDQLMKKHMPGLFERTPDLLHHMTTMMNPMFLLEHGIPVYTVRQNAGEFVITLPRAYHAGFNSGFNIAEAVNFAPPDWLSVGRTCVETYTLDQRRCVFAHDELVMRIAQTSKRLDYKTCRAVIDELRKLHDQENAFRTALADAGVSSSVSCNFEELEDDQRVCRCPDRRLACSRHWQQLCTKCEMKDCQIPYRYSMKQIREFITRLSKRIEQTEPWKAAVVDLLGNGEKIPVNAAKLLLDDFNNKSLLECDEQIQLQQYYNDFRAISQKAQGFFRSAVRLRGRTTGFRSSDLDNVIEALNQCRVGEAALQDSLEKRKKQLQEYSEKVEKATKEVDDSTVLAATALLEQLKTEGEAFNIKLPEVERLRLLIEFASWRELAREMIDKCTTSANNAKQIKKEPKREFAFEVGVFEDATRVKFADLRNLILEGNRLIAVLGSEAKTLEQLTKMAQVAESRHIQINGFLAKSRSIDFFDLVAFNHTVLDMDWLSSPILDLYRLEFSTCRDAYLHYQQLEVQHDYFYHSLDQAINAFERTRLLQDGHQHKELLNKRKVLHAFMTCARRIYQPRQTFFTMFEILAGRDDLPSLIEGGPTALSCRSQDMIGLDNWKDLKRFETEDDMSKHLHQLFEEQKRLLPVLRNKNRQRTVQETCIGAPHCHQSFSRKKRSVQPVPVNSDYVTCYVCQAKDHVECAPWNPVLERYPPSLYLCVRCCRSRRESTLLEISANKQFHLLARLRKLAESGKEDYGDVNPLQMALLFEIQDDEIMSILFEKRARIQERGLPFPLRVNGVDEPSPTKKRRSMRTSNGGAKRQRLQTSDDDDVACGAANCLLPQAASKVRWVMCEGGCSRWLHWYRCPDCAPPTAENETEVVVLDD